MKMRTAMPSNQGGFSILTGFILAIVMFGSLGFFLSGRGISTTFGATYSNMSKVSGIMASAGSIATGFDAVMLNGQPASAVTFNTVANTGIFNPTAGGAAQQALDPSMFVLRNAGTMAVTDGYWIYRGGQIKLNGVGTNAAEYTMIISGLKESICTQINHTLYGTDLTTAPTPLTGFTDTLLLGNATAPTITSPIGVTTIAPDLSSILPAGRMNGCYQTVTDLNYVYIHTLLAQ